MKFNYIIRPSIPIRGVFGRTIYKETLMELDKEEVKTCLKHGPVFRRFDLSNIIKVTLLNLDRLHNEKFIPEEEWKVETPVVKTIEEVTTKVEEPTVETIVEPIAEKEEVTEIVDETTEITTEEVSEAIIEEVAEAPIMEGVDFITEEDKAPVVKDEKPNYNNYKKKKR